MKFVAGQAWLGDSVWQFDIKRSMGVVAGQAVRQGEVSVTVMASAAFWNDVAVRRWVPMVAVHATYLVAVSHAAFVNEADDPVMTFNAFIKCDVD